MKEFQLSEKTIDSVESCLKRFEFDDITSDILSTVKTSICNHLLSININMDFIKVVCDESNNPPEVINDGNIIYKIVETHSETGEEKVFERFI